MKNQSTVALRELRCMVGHNIHTTRRKRKVTLRALSRHTLIPVHKLDGFEIGKYAISFEDLALIAAALNVSVQHMIKTA